MADVMMSLKDNPTELKDVDRKLARSLYALSLTCPTQLEVIVTETLKPKLLKFKGLKAQDEPVILDEPKPEEPKPKKKG